MNYKKSKSFIIWALVIAVVFSQYQVYNLRKTQKEFIHKTDVTFMYLLREESATLRMAEKFNQLSKIKDWNEMNILLGELSSIRNEWINTHMQLAHQTNTLKNIKKETEMVNEFTLLSKKGKESWMHISFLSTKLTNLSLTVKKPNKPDLEKTKAMFAKLSKQYNLLNQEYEILKSHEQSIREINDPEKAAQLKNMYIEKTTKHVTNINNEIDKLLR
jgi:predicted  nucleic acid-binding Zn-ribbon protein